MTKRDSLYNTLAALPVAQRPAFFIRLWLNLTIAGRSVWSSEELSDSEKLNGMKWLNEIQHRVWGAYMQPGQDMKHFLDVIQDHLRNAETVRGEVGWCFSQAISHLAQAEKNE